MLQLISGVTILILVGVDDNHQILNIASKGRDCIASADPLKSRSLALDTCYRVGDHTFESWNASADGRTVTRRGWSSTPGCSGGADVSTAAWPRPETVTTYTHNQWWCTDEGTTLSLGDTPDYRIPPSANTTLDRWAPRWVNRQYAPKVQGYCQVGTPTGQQSYIIGSCYSTGVGDQHFSQLFTIVMDPTSGGVRGDRVNMTSWHASRNCSGPPSNSEILHAGVDDPEFGSGCNMWQFGDLPDFPTTQFPTSCVGGECCCDAALDQACNATRVQGSTQAQSQALCTACAGESQAVLKSAGCRSTQITEYCSASTSKCVDNPEDWSVSFFGIDHTCVDFKEHYCTTLGGYKSGWNSVLGTFDDWQKDGKAATDACCGCGGGTRPEGLHGDPPTPPLSAACTAAQSDPSTNDVGECATKLSELCGAARHASLGNCLLCCGSGSHQHDLRAAGCREPDFERFCDPNVGTRTGTVQK